MNIINPEKDPRRNRLHITIIAAATIATILISLHYLYSGSFIVFQNLFYIPIILSCMYYTMRGFVYSVCLAVFYLLLIIVFTSESNIITQALIRVALFIGIAGVVTFLSTRRKRAERLLLKSEERFRSLFENSVQGIYQTTHEGRFLSANRALSEMFGYDSPEELISSVNDIGSQLYFNPEQRLEHLRILGERGVADNYEAEMYRKDGSIIWVSMTTRVVRDRAGIPFINEGFAENITERKQAEEALQASEEKYRNIFDDAILGIYQTTPDGCICSANPALVKMYGYDTSDELINNVTAAQMYVNSEDREIFKRILSKEGKVEQYEVQFRKRNGEIFWVSINAHTVRDGQGNITHYDGTIEEITERKRLEEALENDQIRLINDQIRLTAVLDSIDALVYVADFNSYEVLFLNKYGHEVWGDIVGRRCWETIQEGQGGPCKFCTNNRLLSDSGIPTGVYRWEFQNTKNSNWYDCRDQAIRWIDGRLVRLEIATDVTERKLTEEEIQNLLSEKELILREVHHRIKNNMTVIVSLLSLQADALEDNPPAIAALEDAGSRVRSMMVLYDKLYRSADFRKISTKEYLPSLVDEIVGNFPNRGLVTIKTQIDDIIFDAKTLSPLGMILNELLTNAMKYAFTGRENGIIAVSLSAKDNHVTLMIQDNGVGIPESIDITASTGFGMQLVGILTEQLEGSMTFGRDNGTKFILEFEV
ncbi:MAG: PAS domain S-box protein [Proteobacteria bacterium]|nr:PAS domain S-box protein [Pseudomonadota bacterium]